MNDSKHQSEGGMVQVLVTYDVAKNLVNVRSNMSGQMLLIQTLSLAITAVAKGDEAKIEQPTLKEVVGVGKVA